MNQNTLKVYLKFDIFSFDLEIAHSFWKTEILLS